MRADKEEVTDEINEEIEEGREEERKKAIGCNCNNKS